jgi:hypothetical protein
MGNHFSVSEREEKSLQLGEGDLSGGSTQIILSFSRK